MNKFLETALRQSALDVGCRPEDFFSSENVVLTSELSPGAKVFLPEVCDFLSVKYGEKCVISVREDRISAVKAFLKTNPEIDASDMVKLGFMPTFENICFLPANDVIEPLPCRYELKFLDKSDLAGLYLPEWSNALGLKRPQFDMFAFGAYHGDKLVGLAGASQDAVEMLQIGVDVLPEYRRQGIAAALTSTLAREIIAIGQTPFYTCDWKNLPSLKNALRSGFRPTWMQLQATAI